MVSPSGIGVVRVVRNVRVFETFGSFDCTLSGAFRRFAADGMNDPNGGATRTIRTSRTSERSDIVHHVVPVHVRVRTVGIDVFGLSVARSVAAGLVIAALTAAVAGIVVAGLVLVVRGTDALGLELAAVGGFGLGAVAVGLCHG